MKITLQIFLSFLIINTLNSQSIDSRFKTLTQDQYREYFPLSTEITQFYPTTDFVCILPTNEANKDLQSETNEFYKSAFIERLPTIPNQIIRVITDKQALLEDLSNINIYAFGTVKGNLWISKFMEKAKDFPIRIKIVLLQKKYITVTNSFLLHYGITLITINIQYFYLSPKI